MEKARKETESTRCPRPGLIPAVLPGKSSRETFLAIGSRSRGAAGFSCFLLFFFFPPFHPIQPCGAELPTAGRQQKARKAASEGGECLKLVLFAQNRAFLMAQRAAGPRFSYKYQPGSSDSTRPRERWGQNLFSPSLGHQNPNVSGPRCKARSQKPRAKRRGPSGLQIDHSFSPFPHIFLSAPQPRQRAKGSLLLPFPKAPALPQDCPLLIP